MADIEQMKRDLEKAADMIKNATTEQLVAWAIDFKLNQGQESCPKESATTSKA